MADDTAPCPYKSLPDERFWRRSVSQVEPGLIDPIINPKFSIGKNDRLATAGSCFAQHIARYLGKSGYNYFVTEKGHNILPPDVADRYNYGVFSARYGNVYTTRQLIQLVRRAYGEFHPSDDCWESGKTFIDPYRPFIQPDGFASKLEYDRDREAHFAAIRQMVENFDVFVFTLGLTEMWYNAEDGAAYPICPGCGAGDHRPGLHKFHNLNAIEVCDDLRALIAFCQDKNPGGRILLTVSPVPLIATMEARHVVTSTVYSKSVLRVAAQMACDEFQHVDYFPSYEIITSSFSRGQYYAADWREINEYGVNHAMSCFFRHYLEKEVERIFPAAKGTEQPDSGSTAEQLAQGNQGEKTLSDRLNQVVCDEEEFDRRL